MTETLYKLTDKDGYTRWGLSGETKWGAGVTVTATGEGDKPCSAAFVHSYATPLLAEFCNPIHASHDTETMLLWEAEGDIAGTDGLKCWGRSLTTLRQIERPEVTTEHRVRFAIACGLRCYREPQYLAWARAWLDGTNRSAEAAGAAWAARAAAGAARAAAWAAEAAEAAWAARAAEAAEEAARAAEEAAADYSIDFAALAEWAVSDAPAPEKWFAEAEQ